MKGKGFLLGMIALGLAGCAGGATEPEELGSQPRYNVSENAPADSAGSTTTSAAFGTGMLGTGL